MKKSLILITAYFALASLTAQIVNYNDVAVIVNNNSPESVEIANYFKAKRNIPEVNMVYINCSTEERVDSAGLFSIINQVSDYLIGNGIDQTINYLVTTKGIPLTFEAVDCDSFPYNVQCSAIDSELTLIINHEDEIGKSYAYQNPYYDILDYNFSQSEYGIYLVTRLDGYTVANVKNLIDRSGPNLKINKNEAQFIFDLAFASDTSGIIPLVKVMEQGNDLVQSKGWNSIYSPGSETFITDESNVLGYFSYIYQPSNKTLNYQWLNGSIAFQGIGETAFTFLEEENIYNDLILANIIEEGVCGAAGTVVPYFLSQGTVWPEILFDRYTYGIELMSETNPYFNLAESYFQSLRVTSSSHIIVGDPKTSIVLDASNGGITIVLQPDSIDGKDAMVWAAPNLGYNDRNLGSDDRLLVHAWTNSTIPDTSRSLIEFDLSGIPTDATIINARLNLYNNPTTISFNGEHSNLSGSNSSVIRRITQAWDETTVTWNTKPSFTTINEVVLDSSTSPNEDFLNIDVTQLIQDMVADPSSNFGFMLQLQAEEYYRALVFASSDHLDLALHPKLEITYLPDSVNCTTIKPNATDGKDASPHSKDGGVNHGDRESLIAYTWTYNGDLINKRAFVEFDFSSIPEKATIMNASLSLFYNPTDPLESWDYHTGENDIYIQRVTSEWDEHTIVWDNQPTTTSQKQVILPPSIDSTQDYLNIDVTAMVTDMIDPSTENNGFMIRMVDEVNYYKGLLFASSDHADANLHPEITICWTLDTSLADDHEGTDMSFDVYPNPNRGVFNLRFPENNSSDFKVAIFNSTGQKISNYSLNNEQIKLFSKGIFIIIVSDQYGNYLSRKVIVL